MARRRRQGRIRRVLGGAIFLLILGGAFWWGLSFVRSAPEEHAVLPGSLLSTLPSSQTPATRPAAGEPGLRRIHEPAGTPSMEPPAPLTTRPSPEIDLRRAQADYQAGLRTLDADVVLARQLLSDALARGLTGSDAADARRRLRELGEKMIFSPARTPGDPLVAAYTAKPGDTIGKIASAFMISEELLSEINRLRNKNIVRVNQTLKVIKGPFHALVDKSDHEMYVCLGDVFVCDFRVALGMDGRTPTGKWLVINHLTNPNWVDPQTGKRWLADDPQNPIGEYWIGLKGLEGEAKDQEGYGIHGTIDEASIGQDVSMGCVRLANRDAAVVYKLLVPGRSTVVIRD